MIVSDIDSLKALEELGKIDTKCEYTIYDKQNGIFTTCKDTALFISPKDKLNNPIHVCGIHRNTIDRMYKNMRSIKRCRYELNP